jgi:hypothetical protein
MAVEKLMFEIYREREFNRAYRVVYYSELNEHNREFEINRAMSGESFLDGYLFDKSKDAAKSAIDVLLQRLNRGDAVDAPAARAALQSYLAE